MAGLIPLKDIPHSARAAESAQRKVWGDEALDLARYKIVTAPGCHGRPYFDPPVLGWVCTQEAAEALKARLTHMPDHSSHHRVSYIFV